MKRALITGITGQDGSYLAELLLQKGYEVHGIVRRTSTLHRTRIDGLLQHNSPDPAGGRLFLHYGDLCDGVSLVKLLYELQPDEVYNLAAQSHVRISFDIPQYTADVTALGALRILEAIREAGLAKKVRFYQASSSEMFGKVQETPQRETTPFWPRSPYACAKVFAHWATVNYRESYGLFACSGILFNHESPRRGENFVTRKITSAVGKIKAGSAEKLYLGNLDARRDWGYAPEYVEGMWRMLQQEKPSDYVLATGHTYSVREFLDAAFGYADLDWREHVVFDPRLLRPAEVDLLVGDASKAAREMGWQARTTLSQLAQLMTQADIQLAQTQSAMGQAAPMHLPA
jgi:GDPmannose 4,6-dehydratase